MRTTVATLVLLSAIPHVLAQKSPSGQSEPRTALDAINREIVRTCQEQDLAATAALWSEDGVDLLPGMEPMVGKAKIAAWLESLRPLLQGAKIKYCTIEWQDVQIHGDVAYEWGINRQLIEFSAPGKSAATEGKILYILKRQRDGQWRIALESWTSSPEPRRQVQ